MILLSSNIFDILGNHYIKFHHILQVVGLAVHIIKYTWQNNEFCLFSSIVLANAELVNTCTLCCGLATDGMKALASVIAIKWY